MAITYVGPVGSSSNASGGASSTITVGAGGVGQNHRIIIAALVGNGTVAPSVPTDSGGNTYALDKTIVSGSDSAWVWSANATTALVNGNTIVVNLPSGNSEFIIIIEEYSGIATSSYGDGTNAGIGTSNNASSGNVVTANANDLLFGAVGWFSGNLTVTWLNSFTHRDQTSLGVAPLADGLDVGDNIVSATGTYVAAATLSGSPGWLAILATYKAVAGAGVAAFMASPPEVRVPRGNRLWVRLELPYLSGQRLAYPPPPPSAPLDPWPIFQRATVVLRRQPRSRRATTSIPPREQEAAPARNLTRAVRRRTLIPHRGESWIPPWGQTPPNAWQVVSTWLVTQRSRFWRITKRGHIVMPGLGQPDPYEAISRSQSIFHFRRWFPFKRGLIKGRIFEPPWFQAAPNAWQVVSTWPKGALRRAWAWRQRRGRFFEPTWYQAADNAWQMLASFSFRKTFRRYAWRRPRMHDEPALMPQQAAAPNPAIVEFLRSIRRRMPVPRRGKRFEPGWGQAVALAPPFVEWWRRARRAPRTVRRRLQQPPLESVAASPQVSTRRRWLLSTLRRRSTAIPDSAGTVQTGTRRRTRGFVRRLRTSPLPLAQVVVIAPQIVDLFRRVPRAWRVTRRAKFWAIPWPFVPPTPAAIFEAVTLRVRDGLAQLRVRTGKTVVTVRDGVGLARVRSTTPISYGSVVLADHPVGYWRLNEASGLVAHDATGHGHDGAISATGIVYSAAGATNDTDTAMTFNGSTGKIDVPFDLALNPAAWSVEGYWNEAGLQAANNPILDCRPASSGPTAAGFDLFLGSGIGIGISVCSTNVTQTILGFTPSPLTGWHHTVATYDGTSARLYVDGVLRAGPTICPYTPNPSRASAIGHITGGGNFVLGSLDDIAVYDYVLSADQVLVHFNAAKAGRFGSSIVSRIRDGLAQLRVR